jgi:MoxR-like ATPase
MLGVSPRGALALQRASRALAASIGRSYVVADDVKVLASSVLEHRLLLSSEAMMRGVNPADVLTAILDTVPVPATRAS